MSEKDILEVNPSPSGAAAHNIDQTRTTLPSLSRIADPNNHHGEKYKMWPLLHFIYPNINLKWIMALNVKGKIMKYLGKA